MNLVPVNIISEVSNAAAGPYNTASHMPTMIATSAQGAASAIYSSSTVNTITGIDYSMANRSTLSVSGDATVGGNIIVNGLKLSDVLASIESRLAILRPNEQLEQQWDNLRALREAYIALEKEIIEKETMWSKLKDTTNTLVK